MNRVEKDYSLRLDESLKRTLIQWASQHHYFAWLDSNNYPQEYGKFEAVLAVGVSDIMRCDHQAAFERLEGFLDHNADWCFGYLGYDLKNDLEDLKSQNTDQLGFPDLCFFVPKKLLFFQEESVRLSYLRGYDHEMDRDLADLMSGKYSETLTKNVKTGAISMHLRTPREHYYEKIEEAKRHIERGDIYEVNICQEIYADHADIDPVATFFHLNELSRPPFASLLKLQDRYILSASPERYLQKSANTVRSQPIKGTSGRGDDPTTDGDLALSLQNDPKERSENIMITDLVRNDLSRVSVRGTVRVEELCGVYTFEQVHQLISTVSCEVPEDLHPVEIIKATFPMGSMTGAPKISAMKIIEELEDARRGVYSGAIGYFTPTGDFDFNVVIRSILYNACSKYLSVSVGGAITAASHPEAEYQECLIKAKAMREVLEGQRTLG